MLLLLYIVLQFPRSDGNRDSLLLKKRHCSVSLAHVIIHYSVGWYAPIGEKEIWSIYQIRKIFPSVTLSSQQILRYCLKRLTRQLFSLSHANTDMQNVRWIYIFFIFGVKTVAFGSSWTSLCSTNFWKCWAIRKKYITSIYSNLRGVSHIARDVLTWACYLQDQPSWSVLHKGRTLLHLYLLKIRCLKLATIEVSSFL